MESVSVYIPFKDSDATLREVLPAVEAQSYPLLEILLVDDGSSAPCEVPLPCTVPARIVRHPKNLGVAAARNTAIREARGEIIASFDADIVPEPSCVAQLVEALAHDSALDGVGGRVTERFTEMTGDLFRAYFMKQDRGTNSLIDVDLFGGCTVYRRTALVEVGGYVEMLRNSFEDFDLSRRVRERGRCTKYLPQARAEHIKRDTVISAVDTLYRWSYPHWESDKRLAEHSWLQERIEYPDLYYERAVSSRIENLDHKIHSDLTLALGRIRGCNEERLQYPLLLYPVRAILHDLILYRACQGNQAEGIADVFGDVLAQLLQQMVPLVFRRSLEDDIRDLVEVLYGEDLWRARRQALAATRSEGVQVLERLLERSGAVSLPSITFIEIYSEMLSLHLQRQQN